MLKISRTLTGLVLSGAALIGLAGCASATGNQTANAKPEPTGDYVTVSKEVINDSWVTKYEGSMKGNKFLYCEKMPMESHGARHVGNSLRVWKTDGTVVTFEDQMASSSIRSNEIECDFLEAASFTDGKSDKVKRFERPYGQDNFYTPEDSEDKVNMDTLNAADREYLGFRKALVELTQRSTNDEIASNTSRLQVLK
ncbi:hypothetical protein J4447_01640 [Candidatus Pacearchaeota archaeon]|nr:hypothetical protein [Candidatus Pacearchaeota archaeon]